MSIYKVGRFLQTLALKPSTFKDDCNAITAFVDSETRLTLQNCDLDISFHDFSEWLITLVRENAIPKKTRGLIFLLIDRRDAFGLTVYGVNQYDPRDDDWSCQPDWETESEAPLEQIGTACKKLNEGEMEPWAAFEAICIAIVKGFFMENGQRFEEASGLKNLHIGVSFSDGDLYKIKIPKPA
ncbi:MAG TPA: hypothetical protein VGO67_21065 [Verrucomicrobiae bacterium]|jgi:hypothetical protein